MVLAAREIVVTLMSEMGNGNFVTESGDFYRLRPYRQKSGMICRIYRNEEEVLVWRAEARDVVQDSWETVFREINRGIKQVLDGFYLPEIIEEVQREGPLEVGGEEITSFLEISAMRLLPLWQEQCNYPPCLVFREGNITSLTLRGSLVVAIHYSCAGTTWFANANSVGVWASRLAGWNIGPALCATFTRGLDTYHLVSFQPLPFFLPLPCPISNI